MEAHRNGGLSSGFTLIEALLVMFLLALAVGGVAPRFTQLFAEVNLQNLSRQVLGSIGYARTEAIRRGAVVSLCPSRMWLSGEADCGGVYSDGWIVFSNADRDAVVDPAEDEVLQVFPALPAGYRVVNRSGTRSVGGLINYLPDGSAQRNLTLQVCPPEGSRASSVSVVLNIVGRARLDRRWGQCVSVV